MRSPICRIGNLEHNEQSFPLLVLYRKENTDSGGAGKHRGGNSAVIGFIPHGTDEIVQDTESSGAAIPTARGLFGGFPACTNAYYYRRDSVDTAVVFRQFYCRACGGLIENEVSRGEDPLLSDIQLAVE